MGGILAAFVTARLTTRASPYKDIADRVMALEKWTKEQSATIKEQDQKIDSLNRTVKAVVQDRDDVVVYLKTFWKWAKNGAKPPPPPIPDHLADVLPPDQWTWPQTVDHTEEG